MVTYKNHCLDCKSMGLPCYGNSCVNRHVPHFHCDKCKQEVDELYHYNEEEWCIECIKKDLGEVEVEV